MMPIQRRDLVLLLGAGFLALGAVPAQAQRRSGPVGAGPAPDVPESAPGEAPQPPTGGPPGPNGNRPNPGPHRPNGIGQGAQETGVPRWLHYPR